VLLPGGADGWTNIEGSEALAVVEMTQRPI
jgi:hypothetical protein